MKSSISLLCFTGLFQVTLSHIDLTQFKDLPILNDNVYTEREMIEESMIRAKAEPCVEQVCDRIVNGTEYSADFSHIFHLGEVCTCKFDNSLVSEKYFCEYKHKPSENPTNYGPDKKVVDSWACEIERTDLRDGECVKELCDLILDGNSEGEDSFQDEYRFGDSCTCSKKKESDSPAKKYECTKVKKVQESAVIDFWICDPDKSKKLVG